MKRKILLVIVLLTALLSACAGSAYSDVNYELAGGGGGEYRTYEAEAPMEMPVAPMADDMAYSEEQVVAFSSTLPNTQERIVIQNADVAVVVADPEAKMDEIIGLAEDLGGFVVTSNVFQTSTPNGIQVPEATVTVRVPAEKLDDVLAQIKADAVEVQYENRSGQDVTAEYVDLASRLKTHQEAADQLSKILDQKTESSEVLDVFNQLVYHREQIELIKGQMKYYEEAAALSAVSVRLIAEETLTPIEIGGWKPQGVARDAIQNLIYFLQGFVDFLINFFLYYVWVILLSLLPFYLVFLGIRTIVRAVKRRKAKAASPSEE